MVDAGGAPLDRYVVLQHLSEGGMGAIYVGKKLGAGGFEMEVVLKQLLPEFTKQEEFIEIFSRFLAGHPEKNMLIDIYDPNTNKWIGEYGFGGFRLF